MQTPISIKLTKVQLHPPCHHIHKYLCGILYNQYSNTHQHWHQQERDNNNNMVTMAMAIFVTKQQPTTINIIM
jgi:hypothetical protein